MKFNPYSISKIGCFNQCPFQFKLKYIDKIRVPFKASKALYKGNHLHEMLEHNFDYDTSFDTNEVYTEKDKEQTKEILKIFKDSEMGMKYKKLIKIGTSEEQFGIKIIDSKLQICDYWDKECWYRGAMDLIFKAPSVVYNIDWKSGKDKSNDEDFGIEQSLAYSIYLMLKYPDIDTFLSVFVFVEHGTEKKITYTRDKLNEYIRFMFNRTKQVESAEHYPAIINGLCNFCDYYKHGHCDEPNILKNKMQDTQNTKISLDF